MPNSETPRSKPVTSSRFERRLPPGRHDLLFRVVFDNDAAGARALQVSRMTVWRWRHDRTPLPQWVLKILPDLIQEKVAEAHFVQNELLAYIERSPKSPRKLSGCCAGYVRREKRPW
jgi:hypothetical protein